ELVLFDNSSNRSWEERSRSFSATDYLSPTLGINSRGGIVPVLLQSADAHGEVTLRLVGKAQKRPIPDSAKPGMKEFSIAVAAQPEAVTGKSLVTMFLDDLSFVTPLIGSPPGVSGDLSAHLPSFEEIARPALGASSPLIDFLKTLHYSLGEYFFRVQDWQ